MSVPEPFIYPCEAHLRKHAPAGYATYDHYKDWLRDDFAFRCVYCLERETWHPSGDAVFSVDHLVPQADDPLGLYVCDYSTLVYACTACNSIRGSLPLLDPTREGLGWHIKV